MTMTLSALSAARFFTITGQQPGWQKPKTRQTRPELQAGLMRDTVRFSGDDAAPTDNTRSANGLKPPSIDDLIQAQADRVIMGVIDQLRTTTLSYDAPELHYEEDFEWLYRAYAAVTTSPNERYKWEKHRVYSVQNTKKPTPALLRLVLEPNRSNYEDNRLHYRHGDLQLSTDNPDILTAFKELVTTNVTAEQQYQKAKENETRVRLANQELDAKKALLEKLTQIDVQAL